MMSMLNQAAVEALCSATYLENYLECMEDLPNDLQRTVSQLRELDAQTHEIMNDIAQHKENYLRHEDGLQRRMALVQLQRCLVKSQEIGDEKLALVSQIIEHIENKTRQLEQDLDNLEPGCVAVIAKEEEAAAVQSKTTPVADSNISTSVMSNKMKTEDRADPNKMKRHRRQRALQEPVIKEEEKKEEDEKPRKKKGKKEKTNEKSPTHPNIDPDEPTYCLCQQVSYGEMIGCDNDQCSIEWFHFGCVGLAHKPKGKWYCPKCRGDKPNTMNADLLDQQRKEKPSKKSLD